MADVCGEDHTNLGTFYKQIIRPQQFSCSQLLTNENQVAGHAGFYSSRDEPRHCLKPFNIKCVRGRREHLFYQLIEHFKRNASDTYPEKHETNSNISNDENSLKICYKYFTLLSYPSPPNKCNCVIDEEVIRLLSPFVAKFYHVRHLIPTPDGDIIARPMNEEDYQKSVFSECLSCPCYGRNPKQKSSCSRDYERVNFLCLEDLTAHCRQPCIIDIKIGQITYDPMAIKEKVLEESSKYRRLRKFGFRILGMKLVDDLKDKNYGKSLETTEQIHEALDSFFGPLQEDHLKSVALGRITSRLDDLTDWFENKNINQLRFYSSSILIVYDSHISNKLEHVESIRKAVSDSVRVNMIDFAHVFHVHEPIMGEENYETLDNNYIFGLKKLRHFFASLESQYQ